MTPAELRAHAEALVSTWPDLAPWQVEALRTLLRPCAERKAS